MIISLRAKYWMGSVVMMRLYWQPISQEESNKLVRWKCKKRSLDKKRIRGWRGFDGGRREEMRNEDKQRVCVLMSFGTFPQRFSENPISSRSRALATLTIRLNLAFVYLRDSY